MCRTLSNSTNTEAQGYSLQVELQNARWEGFIWNPLPLVPRNFPASTGRGQQYGELVAATFHACHTRKVIRAKERQKMPRTS